MGNCFGSDVGMQSGGQALDCLVVRRMLMRFVIDGRCCRMVWGSVCSMIGGRRACSAMVCLMRSSLLVSFLSSRLPKCESIVLMYSSWEEVVVLSGLSRVGSGLSVKAEDFLWVCMQVC